MNAVIISASNTAGQTLQDYIKTPEGTKFIQSLLALAQSSIGFEGQDINPTTAQIRFDSVEHLAAFITGAKDLLASGIDSIKKYFGALGTYSLSVSIVHQWPTGKTGIYVLEDATIANNYHLQST
jgi:hypothetical protein